MIGFFGDIIFETNDKKMLTFSGLQRNSSSRWGNHDVIGRKPTSEYIGPGLDTITFTILLNGRNGLKPRAEMERWHYKEKHGIAETLVIKQKLGDDKWRVKSVSQAWDVVWNKGELFSGKLSIELEEYIEVLRT